MSFQSNFGESNSINTMDIMNTMNTMDIMNTMNTMDAFFVYTYEILNKMYPSMNQIDKQLIHKSLIEVIKFLMIKLNIQNESE